MRKVARDTQMQLRNGLIYSVFVKLLLLLTADLQRIRVGPIFIGYCQSIGESMKRWFAAVQSEHRESIRNSGQLT